MCRILALRCRTLSIALAYLMTWEASGRYKSMREVEIVTITGSYRGDRGRPGSM